MKSAAFALLGAAVLAGFAALIVDLMAPCGQCGRWVLGFVLAVLLGVAAAALAGAFVLSLRREEALDAEERPLDEAVLALTVATSGGSGASKQGRLRDDNTRSLALTAALPSLSSSTSAGYTPRDPLLAGTPHQHGGGWAHPQPAAPDYVPLPPDPRNASFLRQPAAEHGRPPCAGLPHYQARR